MTLLCEIGQSRHCVMMQFSLHHALMRHLQMRFMTNVRRKVALGLQLQELPRCIKFVDGTLMEIQRPW